MPNHKRLSKLLSIGTVYQVIRFSIKIVKLYFIGLFLSSKELGVFSIIAIFSFILESISKTGVTDYLISKKGEKSSNEEWNNAWTIEFIKYVVLFVIALIVAQPIGLYFDIQENIYLIRVFALIFLMNSFKNNRVVLLQKELKLYMYLSYNIIPIFLHLFFTIFLFYKGYGLKALVYGIVFQSFLHIILSYLFVKERPSFYLNRLIIKEQFNFGKWIFMQTWVDFFNEKADRLILAKLISISTLGLFSFVSGFTTDIQFQFRNIFRTILFPFYSKKIGDGKTIASEFLVVLQLISLLTFLGFTLVLLFYNDIIGIVFNHKWDGTVVFIYPLIANAAFGIMLLSIEPLFLGSAKPKSFVKISSIKVLLYIPVLIFLVIFFNEQGIVYSVYFLSFIQFILLVYSIYHYKLIEINRFLRVFIFPLFVLLIIAIFEWFFVLKYTCSSKYIVISMILLINLFIVLLFIYKFKILHGKK